MKTTPHPGGTTSVSSHSRGKAAPILILLPLLTPLLPLQAQTRATLLEPATVPIVQNGKPIGSAIARAGTIVQILNRTADSVEISTPLGSTTVPSAHLLLLEEKPSKPHATYISHAPPSAKEEPEKNAYPEIPKTSSIKITETTKKRSTTGGRCRGSGETQIFSPTITLGKDAEANETRFELYVVYKAWIKNPPQPNAPPKPEIKPTPSNPLGLAKLQRSDGEIKTLASKRIDETVTQGQPFDKTAAFGWFNWSCSCCRLMNPPVKPQLIGWRAELLADGQLLASAQSSNDTRIAKAVEELKAKPSPR